MNPRTRHHIVTSKTKYDLCKKSAKDYAKKCKQSQKQIATAQKAQAIVTELAEAVQKRAYESLAVVVSEAMQSVFDEPYELLIEFVQRRGNTECDLMLQRDGQRFSMSEMVGGGVLDVASFALRIAVVATSLPAKRRLIVMDEPFKFVSEQYRRQAAGMIEILAEKLDFQFVYVTHIRELEFGTVIRL